MGEIMRNGYLGLGILLLATTLPLAARAQLADTTLFTDAELKKLGAGTLISKGATVSLSRRTASGMVEVHDKFSDVLVGREGHVTLITGGTLTGSTQNAATGEWRGGTITGGKSQDFGPGDVVWIPAGVPHLMILKEGETFVYLAVKIPAPVESANAPRP